MRNIRGVFRSAWLRRTRPGMGYAACFLSALGAVARQQGKTDAVKNASVAVDVSIGEPSDKPGFGLAVDLKVSGADDALIKAAHEVGRFAIPLEWWRANSLCCRCVPTAVRSPRVLS